MKVFTKFEVDTIIRCLVIALLLLIHYVSLWPWHVTFWPCSVVIHGGSRGQPSTKFEDPTAIHSWVTTSDIWHYTTLMALRLRQMESSAKTMYGPVLKTTQLSAHAQNHASIERCRKSFTIIVLGDLHFPWIASNFGNLTAFTAIFSHIFTAHEQKRLFMNFRLNSDITIRFIDPDFLIGHDISAIWVCFLLIFALEKLNVRHISTSGLVHLLTCGGWTYTRWLTSTLRE